MYGRQWNVSMTESSGRNLYMQLVVKNLKTYG